MVVESIKAAFSKKTEYHSAIQLWRYNIFAFAFSEWWLIEILNTCKSDYLRVSSHTSNTGNFGKTKYILQVAELKIMAKYNWTRQETKDLITLYEVNDCLWNKGLRGSNQFI